MVNKSFARAGAYGVLRNKLVRFMHEFESKHRLPLDPNDTAKAFYWFHKMVTETCFQRGDTVVLIPNPQIEIPKTKEALAV